MFKVWEKASHNIGGCQGWPLVNKKTKTWREMESFFHRIGKFYIKDIRPTSIIIIVNFSRLSPLSYLRSQCLLHTKEKFSLKINFDISFIFNILRYG